MPSARAIVQMLFKAFPQTITQDVIAPHDCEECQALRDQLSNITWQDVPSEFINANDGALPLLSHAAYVAFLAAWLHHAVQNPDGPVADMVLVNLESEPDVKGFSRDQANVIIEVARFLARSNFWGPEDPVNIESVAEIERVWSRVAP